jgi:hypothetical protein
MPPTNKIDLLEDQLAAHWVLIRYRLLRRDGSGRIDLIRQGVIFYFDPFKNIFFINRPLKIYFRSESFKGRQTRRRPY